MRYRHPSRQRPVWHLQKRSDYLDFIGRARAPQAAGTSGGYGHSRPCAKSSERQRVFLPRCSSFLLLAVNAGSPAYSKGPRLLVCLGGKATGSRRIAGHSHGSTRVRRLAQQPSSLRQLRPSFQHSAYPTHLHPAMLILAGHPWVSAALSLSIQCPHISISFTFQFCADL